MKSKDYIAEAFFAACAFLVFGTFIVFAAGYGISRCWNLVVPDLFGAPEATVRNGIGLAGLLFLFRSCIAPLSVERK